MRYTAIRKDYRTQQFTQFISSLAQLAKEKISLFEN